MIYFTVQDASDLQQVNWLAKNRSEYKNFCYDRVKTPLLERFGEFDGYDEHYFERESWADDYGCGGDWFSSHSHILKRYKLGGMIFHQPTNEYSYEDAREHHKQSPNYTHYKMQCKNRLDGIKDAPETFDRQTAIKSLRRLVHKFKGVLRVAAPKPRRDELMPFSRIRWNGWMTWDKQGFYGWIIRPPNDIAVCQSCGGKLQFNFDLFDIERFVEERRIANRLSIRCDAARTSDHKTECEQHRIEARRDWGGTGETREPWEQETAIVRTWLPTILPKLIRRDLGKLRK